MTELEQQLAILLKDAPGEPPVDLDPDTVGSLPVSRRRYLAPLLAVATVLVVVAIYAVVALVRSHDRAQPAVDRVEQHTIGRLWNIADQAVREVGTRIKVAQAVLTTAAEAESFLFDASSSNETTQPTWAVQIQTTSDYTCCHDHARPQGQQRRFHVIVLLIRATTFDEVAVGHVNAGHDMSRLGKVITLHDTGVPTPTPTPAPAEIQTYIINHAHTTATVFGCPQCNAHGQPLRPNHSMRWTERRTNARYSVIVDGHHATCTLPPAPTAGERIALAYDITPAGQCTP